MQQISANGKMLFLDEIYQSWILLTINVPKLWTDSLPRYNGKQPYMQNTV